MNRRLPALVLPVLLLAGACTTTGPDPTPTASDAAVPFADCATLTTPVAAGTPATGTVSPTTGESAAGDPAAAGDGRSEPLPDLRLPCFTGGEPISLGQLRGPAVVNLWASWCTPCRAELPAFQRLSQRTEGRLRVIGVNSKDRREGARSVGEDFGITFPNLYDPTEQLRNRLARAAFPVTLFVDGQGRIRHVDQSGALDDERLAALVSEHLGVAVGG